MRTMFLIFLVLVITGIVLYDEKQQDAMPTYKAFASNCKTGTMRWQIVRNDNDVLFSASCTPRD